MTGGWNGGVENKSRYFRGGEKLHFDEKLGHTLYYVSLTICTTIKYVIVTFFF